MHRFYAMQLSPTLFSEWALVAELGPDRLARQGDAESLSNGGTGPDCPEKTSQGQNQAGLPTLAYFKFRFVEATPIKGIYRNEAIAGALPISTPGMGFAGLTQSSKPVIYAVKSLCDGSLASKAMNSFPPKFASAGALPIWMPGTSRAGLSHTTKFSLAEYVKKSRFDGSSAWKAMVGYEAGLTSTAGVLPI
jgi:hypothetical protein